MTFLFVKLAGDPEESVPLVSSSHYQEHHKHTFKDLPGKAPTDNLFPASPFLFREPKLLCGLSATLSFLVLGLVCHYLILCDVCDSSSPLRAILPPVHVPGSSSPIQNLLPPINPREELPSPPQNLLPPINVQEELPSAPPPYPQEAETGGGREAGGAETGGGREAGGAETGGGREAGGAPPALPLCRNKDVENGRWVRTAEDAALLVTKDGAPTTYDTSCPFVLASMACLKNGHSLDFLKWEWQPHGCHLPSFDAAEFGRVMANRTLLMAGDSLMDSNFAPALLCAMHRHAPVQRKDLGSGDIHEMPDPPPNWQRHRNLKMFLWMRFNVWVLVLRSPFLSRVVVPPGASGSSKGNLDVYLDEPGEWSELLSDVDVLVVNSGVWWGGPRARRAYFKKGRLLNSTEMDRRQAYGVMLDTVTKALRGPKAWPGLPIFLPNLGRGGKYCNTSDPSAPEEVPSFGVSNPIEAHFLWRTRRALDPLPRFPVLGVELLTRLRRDAHPGTFHDFNASKETWHDCLHWCTPGVPDTWVRVLLTTIKEYLA